jgi:hypothetical protein
MISVLRQQHPETSLLEMTIGCEGLADPVLLHDHKRNAVRQGPILIWAISIQPDSALEELWRRRDDFDVGRRLENLKQVDKGLTRPGVGQAIGYLGQDPSGCNNGGLRPGRELYRLVVESIPHIEARKKYTESAKTFLIEVSAWGFRECSGRDSPRNLQEGL